MKPIKYKLYIWAFTVDDLPSQTGRVENRRLDLEELRMISGHVACTGRCQCTRYFSFAHFLFTWT